MTVSKLIFALWIVFYAYWAISAIGVKKPVRGKPWIESVCLRILLVIIALALFRVLHVHVHVPVRSSNSVADGIGACLCVAGLAFAVWARRHLGRNWGMPMSLKQGHELITTGPYRRLRHPIYTGILLAILGSCIVGGRVWLVVFVVVGAFLIYSARTEERLMMQAFPREYPEYKKKTKALIPLVW
jgi:protein-S-isoprenylcysteine O-methyltransferase Ste14